MELVTDGKRRAARFARDACVRYAVEGNFRRAAGTVMLHFKPAWGTDLQDDLGRVLWDLRIDHGSVVADDPSQRYALVFPNPRARERRGEATVDRWRFCVATNRNRYIIGRPEKRAYQRTRQAVFSRRQSFPPGTWLHLAVTWESTAGAIFIDGRLEAQAPLPEGLPDRPLPRYMQLRAIPSWINAGAEGLIADFRIYGRALSVQEIAAAMVDGGANAAGSTG